MNKVDKVRAMLDYIDQHKFKLVSEIGKSGAGSIYYRWNNYNINLWSRSCRQNSYGFTDNEWDKIDNLLEERITELHYKEEIIKKQQSLYCRAKSKTSKLLAEWSNNANLPI